MDNNKHNGQIKADSPLYARFEKLIKDKLATKRERTAGNYSSTLNKLCTYLGNRVGEFRIEEVTASFLHDYIQWLQFSCSIKPGTVDFYIRTFRAMYNHVLKEGGIDLPDSAPFKSIHISVPDTRKRALPEGKIQSMTTLDLSTHSHLLDALRLALFLFFGRGMCFVDAFRLKQSDIEGEYIFYERSKTGVFLQVKITPEMQHIINMYKEEGSNWLFPFLHKRRYAGEGELSVRSSLKRTNRHLKEIGKIMELRYPLTTYVMRHSFASMMLESDAALSIIRQCLGHTSVKTTEVYLSGLPSGKIDKATDEMLDTLVRQPAIQDKEAPNNNNTGSPRLVQIRIVRRQNTFSDTKELKLTGQEIQPVLKNECPSLNKRETFISKCLHFICHAVAKIEYSTE